MNRKMNSTKKVVSVILGVLLLFALATGTSAAQPISEPLDGALLEELQLEETQLEDAQFEEAQFEETVLEETSLSEEPLSEDSTDTDGDSFEGEVQLLSEIELLENKLEKEGAEYDGFLVTLDEASVQTSAEDAVTSQLEFTENVCVAQSAQDILHDYDYSDICKIEPNYVSHLADVSLTDN